MAVTGQKKRYEGFEGRIRIVGIGLVLALAVLVLRLWDLQIVHWSEYKGMAEHNRLRPQRLVAPRGMIYGPDTSVVLADNRPSCDLVIVPAECREADVESVCTLLANLVGVDGPALLDKVMKILKSKKRQIYTQILIKKDVSKDDLTRVEEFSHALPGVFAVVRPQRRYLQGSTAGQILGYMGEISDKELRRLGRYEAGDLVGRSGLEQMYEPDLRGADGQLVAEVYAEDPFPQLRTDPFGRPYMAVDSFGHRLEKERQFRTDPTPGTSIFTTLDIGLQRHCEGLLEGKIGAIVVLDADTGEVRALASVPGYDPNIFVTHGHSQERKDALTVKPNPMTHRCYREAYAPGSVFKVLLATAALEEGIITRDSTFFCPGFFQLEGVDWKWLCWNHAGHGTVNVVDALAYSCDVFFYNVGIRLGVDKIKEWTGKLGLGVKTGLDLPQEVEGLIPSREWKEATQKEIVPNKPWEWRWYPGNTVNLSIGQGEAITSPLQNAVMIAAIVNGGRRIVPHINKALEPQVSEPLVHERTLAIVREGLRKCVEKDKPPPTGTGKAAKCPGKIVIGKTGSAQVASLEELKKYAKEEDVPYEKRDHAWFVAGVLDQQPRLAICVLVEHGWHGASAAAPLAKDVIEYFYGPRPGAPVNLAQRGSSE